MTADWTARLHRRDVSARALPAVLEPPARRGALERWSRGWGVDKIQRRARTPVVRCTCEDYGLLRDSPTNGQHPRVHAVAERDARPNESPVFNTIARSPAARSRTST